MDDPIVRIALSNLDTYTRQTGRALARSLIRGQTPTAIATQNGGTGGLGGALGTMSTQNANNVNISGGSIIGITDLAVADGGTGASTAFTARDNLGIGTTDSPQFAAVNIGNAADTTLTRASAGVLAVEGANVYVVGGVDVAITDGGTGASTALAGFNALSPITTRGDLITKDATNNVRLAVGAARTFIRSDGVDPSWQRLAPDVVNATGQTGSIGTTNIATTPAVGLYSVQIWLAVTTGAVGSTITVTIGWTDEVGATTSTPSVLNLFSSATTGRQGDQEVIYVASGSPTYATTVAGGVPTYNLRIRMIPL